MAIACTKHRIRTGEEGCRENARTIHRSETLAAGGSGGIRRQGSRIARIGGAFISAGGEEPGSLRKQSL